MADNHSPTVVQPNIPAADMTPLERLILDLVFDAENEEGGIYYHSWCGPSAVVTLSVDDLRTACAASRDHGESSIGEHVGRLLSQYDADASDDPPDDIDVDLTTRAGTGCFRTSCAARRRSTRSWSQRRLPARRCGQTASAAA